MAGTRKLTVEILGDASRLGVAVRESETKLGRLSSAAGLAAGGLATATAAAVGAIVAVGLEVEDMQGTILRGTGATGEALDGLTDSALDVLGTVPNAAGDVASALADVNTFFGLTGDELEEVTELFLDFGRVAGVEAGQAAGAVDAMLTQFGEGVDGADEALGDLLRISQATGAPMGQLLGQMETFGPVFANAGFGLEETAGILGQLEMAGVDLTRVGPALNAFFRKVAEDGGDPQDAIRETVATIGEASSEMEALALATEAFGAEGAQRMVSAIRSGNFDLEDFNGLLGSGAGLVEEQSDLVLTLSDRFAMLKNKALAGLAPAAIVVFDAVVGAVEQAMPYLEQFGGWFQSKIGPLVEQAMPYLEQFEQWFRVNAGAALDELRAAWVEVEPVIVAGIDLVIEKFAELVAWAQDHGLPVWVALFGAVRAFAELAFEVVSRFVTNVADAWAQHKDTVLPILETLFTGARLIVESFLALFTAVFDGVAWVLDNAIGEMQAWADFNAAVIDAVIGFFGAIPGRVTSALSSIAETVTAPFRAAFNAIRDLWNSTVGGFGFSVPSWVPGIGGRGWSVPRMHSGGVVPGSPGSDVLAILQAGETVIPRDVSPGYSGGAGVTINVSVAPTADKAAIGAEIVDAINAAQRRGAVFV